MPLKEATERQLARMLGQTDVTVDLTFAVPDGAPSKNTPAQHLANFYKKFSEVRNNHYDGVVVTGAPVEHLPFEEVTYWSEMEDIFEWIRETKVGMYSICWGAMATLHHFFGVPKHLTKSKQFGLFPHQILKPCEMTAGLEDGVGIPVSRHTEWKMEDMTRLPEGIDVVMASEHTGPCVIWDKERSHVHMMNHFEYEVDTLDGEYRRDVSKGTPTGEPIPIPFGYYPNDDPNNAPVHKWRANGTSFFSNWLKVLASKRPRSKL
jgi:homoserine O-succinyltransferase